MKSRKPSKVKHNVSLMAKPVGPICNLDCEYCYYLEKERLYPERGRTPEEWRLPEELLEAYIRQTCDNTKAPVVSFLWQGGEPTLLGIDYFRTAVQLQHKYAGGRRVDNAFQTNGTLITDEWAEFLAEHRFLVGISIDGDRKLHDRLRVDKGGKPSFDKVMRAIETFKKHGTEFNTLTVVQNDNAGHPLEVYRFLREIGSGHMQFIPIVERMAVNATPDGLVLLAPKQAAEAKVTPWSVKPEDYGKFLVAVFDEWVRHDVGKVYVQIVEVTFEAWLGLQPSLCVFRETCGDAMVMEHNGDVYSCDHFVYPEYKIGNITQRPMGELANLPEQRAFGEDKRKGLTDFCRRCDVQFICNGECPKHRFATSPDGEPGHNYLCAAYKMFFKHVGPFMDFMAEEFRGQRPPANVIQWALARDRQELSEQPPPAPRYYRPSSKKHRRGS